MSEFVAYKKCNLHEGGGCVFFVLCYFPGTSKNHQLRTASSSTNLHWVNGYEKEDSQIEILVGIQKQGLKEYNTAFIYGNVLESFKSALLQNQ